jgi:ATP-dependent protease HslVU (ClpYQ) peptidase subunit
MSVVAYKNGIIAADRMLTSSEMIIGSTKKIARVKSLLAGATGEVTQTTYFLEMFKSDLDLERWSNSSDIVSALNSMNSLTENIIASKVSESTADIFIITSWHHVISFESSQWSFFSCVDQMYASGSGREFATGAMLAGATPAQAIEIASRRCPYCGLGADVISVGGLV